MNDQFSGSNPPSNNSGSANPPDPTSGISNQTSLPPQEPHGFYGSVPQQSQPPAQSPPSPWPQQPQAPAQTPPPPQQPPVSGSGYYASEPYATPPQAPMGTTIPSPGEAPPAYSQQPSTSAPQPQPATAFYQEPVASSPTPPSSPSTPPPPGTPPPSNGGMAPAATGVLSKMAKIGIGVGVGFLFLILFSFVILPLFLRGGPPKDVTLQYWGLWEDPKVMQALISDFERQNPHIKVKYTSFVGKDYKDRLITRTKNGIGPDIFRYHNTWVPMISDMLLPLPSDVITPTDFKNTYFPVTQSDLVQNGAIYGIPMEMDTLAMFTNPEIFANAREKVPTLWAEIPDTATALTVKDETSNIKTSGVALGTVSNVDHATDIVALLMAQNGVDLKKIAVQSTAASGALDFYTSFAKDVNGVWNDKLDSSRLAFAQGKVAMFFGYSWDIFMIKSINPQLNFEVHPIPALPGGRGMSIASYWVEGVSSKTKYKKEALLFMHYLAQKETAQKFYTEASKVRIFGEPYARKDLAQTLTKNPLTAPFVNQAPKAVSTYFASDTWDGNGINSQMNGYLTRAVENILSGTSPETEVTTLDNGVKQVLTQYGIN